MQDVRWPVAKHAGVHPPWDELLPRPDEFEELLGEFGGEEVSASGAQPLALPPSGHQLRCLDSTHEEGCTLCQPLPAAGAGADVCSVAGLKPLRRLLLLTSEWNSSTARECAADAVQNLPGGARTARVLRTRSSRDISKSCLLMLCRLWGYKSDAFLSRGDIKRKRGRAAAMEQVGGRRLANAVGGQLALALTTLPRLPLPGMCTLEPTSLRFFVSSQLAPLLRASSDAFEGPRSRVMTFSDGTAPFTLGSLDAYAAMTQIVAAMHGRMAAAASSQRAWAAPALQYCAGPWSAGAAEPETAAAWQLVLLCPEEGGATAHLREVSDMLKTGVRMLNANSPALHFGGQADAAPTAFSVAQEEYAAALRDGSAFVAAANLLLAQLSAGSGMDVYLVGAEALLAAAAAYMADTSAAFRRRRDWSAEALQNRGAQPLSLVTGQGNDWVSFSSLPVWRLTTTC